MDNNLEPLRGNEASRIPWVDVMKFLGIFAIYLGHFEEAGGRFYPFVFSYHVPLFFFIGGFFVPPIKQNKKTTVKDFFSRESAFIKKKALGILVPYYFFSLVTLIALVAFNDKGITVDELKNMLFEMLLGRRNHIAVFQLWFLTCYFSICLIYRWLLLIVRSPWIALLILLPLNLYHSEILNYFHIEPCSWFYNIDSALSYLVYFSAGQCVFPYLMILWENRKNQKWILWILTVFSGIFACKVFFFGTSHTLTVINRLNLDKYLGQSAFFLQTMVLLLFQFCFAILLSNIEILKNIGQNSIILCCTELLTKTILAALFYILAINISAALVTPLTVIFYSLICCFVSYYIFAQYIPKKMPGLAFFFGKQPVQSMKI